MKILLKIVLVCLTCSGCILTGYGEKKTQGYDILPDGVSVVLEMGTLTLKVCTGQIIRVLFEPAGVQKEDSSLVVILDPVKTDFDVYRENHDVVVSTDYLTVRGNTVSGAVAFYNRDHKLLFAEDSDCYDFWTGEKYDGGRWVEKEVPIDIMPVYVRAGTILPMGPRLQYAMEKPADPIELRIYAGDDAEWFLYEDEGDGYDYENGVFSLIPIRWDENNQILNLGKREGKFPGMPLSRLFHIVLVNPGKRIGKPQQIKQKKIVHYKGEKIVVRL
ncbi:MAG: hypothetical protein DRP86_00225 [Candidatus Neomarinimicrobiota bacterium]|nr:MAG: hypothetical protein DRP86_00225 [Candidatus Neomarinimicrobiota bacterium]